MVNGCLEVAQNPVESDVNVYRPDRGCKILASDGRTEKVGFNVSQHV